MRLRELVGALLALGFASCGSDGGTALEPLALPEGCNPLASTDAYCLLPYPSDVFRQEDPTARGGFRVRVTGEALPRVRSGVQVDLLALHPTDGFSPGAQILALFPGGVDGGPLVGAGDDLAESVSDASPSLIVEAETGRRILHLAELDPRADVDTRRALAIRPLERLEPGRRYVVALRGLVAPDGNPVPSPEGFRRIRDGLAGGDPLLAPLARRYRRELFPVLAAQGVERGALTLAWDFTVSSEAVMTRDLDAIRDDLVRRLAERAPPVTVLSVEDDVDDRIARRIQATMRVPLYLTRPGIGARLARDANGDVVANGEVDVPFTVHVPRSVAGRPSGAPPARVLQYGHGFFGSRDEAGGGFLTSFADDHGFVIVVCDWWGMAFEDQIAIGADILFGPETTMRWTDRLHQGYANFVALAEVAQHGLVDLPELRFDGRPAYDPSELYYYGISQGAILGGTYLAMSPHVRRAVLGVGGANYAFMMFRALPFETFLAIIGVQTSDPLVQQIAVSGIQGSFDRIDPLTYASRVLADPWEGAQSDRRVLMQIGVGDAQVPNLSAHLHARAMGVPLMLPAPREIVGVETVDGPVEGSAMVELDFGVRPLPDETAELPDGDNAVHEGVRRVPAGIEQVDRFLTPAGRIELTCDGVCDPD